MNIQAMQRAIDNNGEVLDALIEELGVADKLRARLDERSYEKNLKNCRAELQAGRGRNADAGPGTIVLGRGSNGLPLAVNFDGIESDKREVFQGRKEGDVVTLPDGSTITLTGVFDLRRVAPAGDGKHPANRRKGKRK